MTEFKSEAAIKADIAKEEEEAKESMEGAADRDKRRQIEIFWMKADNKALKEYQEGLKDGFWVDSIIFAVEKLGIEYESSLRPNIDKWLSR